MRAAHKIGSACSIGVRLELPKPQPGPAIAQFRSFFFGVCWIAKTNTQIMVEIIIDRNSSLGETLPKLCRNERNKSQIVVQ